MVGGGGLLPPTPLPTGALVLALGVFQPNHLTCVFCIPMASNPSKRFFFSFWMFPDWCHCRLSRTGSTTPSTAAQSFCLEDSCQQGKEKREAPPLPPLLFRTLPPGIWGQG
ncbi:unnamed protein product [Discosporangium mesarthrocarpum]